jgi:hypothetical protein
MENERSGVLSKIILRVFTTNLPKLPRQAKDSISKRNPLVGEKKKCFLQATEAAAQSEGEDSVAYRDARAIAERWCEKENNPKKRSILRYHCLTNYEPRSFAKTGSGQA